MRIWFKTVKNARIKKDISIEDFSDDSRTTKVFRALNDACKAFDLSVPIWLKINVEDFQRHAKTRFTQDSFIENIDFDYLEVQVIEEDY